MHQRVSKLLLICAGTIVDKTIDELLKGELHYTTRCVHVDFESKRTEEFLDVQMVVQGCKNVYDSFDKLTEARSCVLVCPQWSGTVQDIRDHVA